MINEPSIGKLQVSIRVVRVGSKQMTLQIFKQLGQIDVCGKDGKLTDGLKPWGVVNVVVDDRQPWLLGEVKGQLMRAVLNPADMTEHLQRTLEFRKQSIQREEGSSTYSFNASKGAEIDAKIAEKRAQIAKCELELVVEPQRLQAHRAMAALPQLFIGA